MVDLNSDNIPEAKFATLNQVDFYKVINQIARKNTASAAAKMFNAKSKSYHVRRKDIKIGHVSHKKHTEVMPDYSDEINFESNTKDRRGMITYDDFKYSYCNFDKDVEHLLGNNFEDYINVDQDKNVITEEDESDLNFLQSVSYSHKDDDKNKPKI